jgi:hypothetical protein
MKAVLPSGGPGRSRAPGKTQGPIAPAPYEDIRAWCSLREIATDSAGLLESPFGLPLNQPVQSYLIPTPMISRSPETLLGIDNGDIWACTVEAAIQSAYQALGPVLRQLALHQESDGSKNKKEPTSETLAQYHERARILLRRYCDDCKSPVELENIDLQHLAEWLLAKRLTWKPQTWRFYRTALSDFLGRIDRWDAARALAILRAEDEDYATLVGDKTNVSQRVKFFSLHDFHNAVSYCANKFGKQSDHTLGDYLQANLAVGLRPWEFLTSEMRCIPDKRAPFGRQVWLFVCNAKFSAGHANGPVRAIDLSALSGTQIQAIQRTIQGARMQHEITCYNDWLRTSNNVLHRLFKRGVTTHKYSMYSVRHQAVANWKLVYDHISVAALCGHATPTTAKVHYGSVKSAWSAARVKDFLVRPSQADIQRLKDRLEMSSNRNWR